MKTIQLTKLQSEALVYFVEGKCETDPMPKNYSNSKHALRHLGMIKHNSEWIDEITDLGNSTYFSL